MRTFKPEVQAAERGLFQAVAFLQADRRALALRRIERNSERIEEAIEDVMRAERLVLERAEEWYELAEDYDAWINSRRRRD